MSVFLRYLLVIVISYFIGNFAPSYFIGKITKNIDIRDYGSGNAGATNTFGAGGCSRRDRSNCNVLKACWLFMQAFG